MSVLPANVRCPASVHHHVPAYGRVSFMATLLGATPARAPPRGRRNVPSLNMSLAARATVAAQTQKRKAAKAVSARAAAQTVPRQRSSRLR